MTSMSVSGLIGEEDYREEDVPYWAYQISRLAPASQTFWALYLREMAQMDMLTMYVNAGQLGNVAFQRSD